MVIRELECSVKGYEWFRWLRNDLSGNDARTLVRRGIGVKPKEEREVASRVICTALEANPGPMKTALEESHMTEEVEAWLDPIFRKRYRDALARAEREKDEAVAKAIAKAAAERDEAVALALKEAACMQKLITDILAGLEGNRFNSAAMAKLQAFKEIYGTE